MSAGEVQSTYDQNIRKANPGLPYDVTPLDAYGRSAEGSAIRYGAAVVQGTNDNQARYPDSADVLGNGAVTAKFRGIVIREHVREGGRAALASPVGDGETSYANAGETLSLATTGRIWAIAEAAVTPNDPVFYRHASGAGGSLLGALRNDADTATANEIQNARWVTSAGAGELAVIELSVGGE